MKDDAINDYNSYLQYEDATNQTEDRESYDSDELFPDRKKNEKNNKPLLILLIICIVIIMASGSYLIYRLYLQHLDDAVYDEIARIANEPPSNIIMGPEETPPITIQGYSVESGYAHPVGTQQPQQQPVYDDSQEHGFEDINVVEPSPTPVPEYYQLKSYTKNFAKLLEINKNCVGWIEIKNTKVNYPVVYSADSQKYLDTGFDGKPNRNGTIYCTGGDGTDCQNLTLYGHRSVSNGAMFGCLGDYKSQSFYKKHSTINYYTPSGGNYTYTIFAAFNVKITGRTFNYTQANFLNDKDFQNFISTAKRLSYYDTGISVPDGAHILTLSTCDGSDNRMIVMGYR